MRAIDFPGGTLKAGIEGPEEREKSQTTPKDSSCQRSNLQELNNKRPAWMNHAGLICRTGIPACPFYKYRALGQIRTGRNACPTLLNHSSTSPSPPAAKRELRKSFVPDGPVSSSQIGPSPGSSRRLKRRNGQHSRSTVINWPSEATQLNLTGSDRHSRPQACRTGIPACPFYEHRALGT